MNEKAMCQYQSRFFIRQLMRHFILDGCVERSFHLIIFMKVESEGR